MTRNPSTSATGGAVRLHLPTHVTHVSLDPLDDPHGAELPTPQRVLRGHADVRPTASSVTTPSDGARFEVTLAGDVDLALAPELARAERQLEQHCAQVPRARVHLDVRAVSAVDGSALRFVERVRGTCVRQGTACTTSAARPVVDHVLSLARPVVDGELAAS